MLLTIWRTLRLMICSTPFIAGVFSSYHRITHTYCEVKKEIKESTRIDGKWLSLMWDIGTSFSHCAFCKIDAQFKHPATHPRIHAYTHTTHRHPPTCTFRPFKVCQSVISKPCPPPHRDDCHLSSVICHCLAVVWLLVGLSDVIPQLRCL